jgi:sugar lactone lactonase YvrE
MRAALAVVFCLPIVLTGCALNSSNAPTPDAGLAIHGSVHGGQPPIVGAQVYLLAAGSSGYGSKSQSLLTSVPGSTTLDTSAGPTNGFYYVTSSTDGSFSITGDYSCTPNTQVYIYALGGNPGSGANSAAGLLAVLGNCPSTGNFLTATPFVFVNEVSTVAAAYSIAGFATDATHVSTSNTTLGATGLQNAFANAANLAGLSTGAALPTTPAGNGTVPQNEINTLANILAACVNSTGPSSTPCSTLFTNAESAGSSGTAPTDTATAAINIAHNPAANVATLYGLTQPTPPFGPALSTQPSDFTIALSFTGGGINSPFSLAIDGTGNVWMVNTGTATVTEMNGVTGAAISPSGGFNAELNAPFSVAIDPSGNAWVVDATINNGFGYTNTAVTVFTPSGGIVSGSPFTGGGLDISNNDGLQSPRDIAFDANGNAWIANSLNGSVTELNGLTAAAMSPAITGYPVPGTRTSPSGIAVDGSGNLWVSGFNNATLYEMKTSDGSVVGASAAGAGGLSLPFSVAVDAGNNIWLPDNAAGAGTEVSKFTNVTTGSAFSGGGTLVPDGIAIDGAGNVWVSNQSAVSPATRAGVSEYNNLGIALSPPVGYASSQLVNGGDIGVDGSGNVWVANAATASDGNGLNVVEFVGAAVPAATPLSVAVSTGKLGSRP